MVVQQLLLEALEELIDDDFNTFKWYLTLDILEGCKPLKKSQMESANRPQTVTKMEQSYGLELSVSITIEILKKMGKNGNAADLKREYEAKGGKPASGSASASTSASSSAAAPPAGGVMAQGGSVVIAPSVTGGTSGTWNITVNK